DRVSSTNTIYRDSDNDRWNLFNNSFNNIQKSRRFILMKRKRYGFTLIEMAIVLFIISLLNLIILPNIYTQRKHANTVYDNALQTQLNTQAELYMDEKNTNTVTIDELKSANYLNNDQYDQIKKKNIEIKLDNGKKE